MSASLLIFVFVAATIVIIGAFRLFSSNSKCCFAEDRAGSAAESQSRWGVTLLAMFVAAVIVSFPSGMVAASMGSRYIVAQAYGIMWLQRIHFFISLFLVGLAGQYAGGRKQKKSDIILVWILSLLQAVGTGYALKFLPRMFDYYYVL